MEYDQVIERVRRPAGDPASRRLDGMAVTDRRDARVAATRPRDAARNGVRAVFRMLREAVPGDEFEDVRSELTPEHTTLLEEGERTGG